MFTEALVVGGGPAGAVAALTLARAGLGVVVLERSDYSAERPGETLPPETRVALWRLGVWERFAAAGHLPSPGIVAVWGDDRPAENDFVFNPFGNGWHLDRRRFDRMLIESAADAGCRVFCGAGLLDCRPADSGGWEFRASVAGRAQAGRCAFLLDATGRAAFVARRRGARRTAADRLVGITGFFDRGKEAEDVRTLVEAFDGGWWYSAGLPDQRLVVALMTDSDLVPRAEGRDDYWLACLERAPHTRRRVLLPGSRPDLRVRAAHGGRLDAVAGADWLAVGDSAMAFDPLSSQGIATALKGGVRAGEAAASALAGDRDASARYADWVDASWAAYTRQYRHQYGRERRWRGSTFWSRRLAHGSE